MIDDSNIEFAKAFIGTSVAVLFLCYYYEWSWSSCEKSKDNDEGQLLTTTVVSPSSSCPNPNCIRCQKYRQVQKTAKTRMPWIVKELKKQYPNIDNNFDRIQKSVVDEQKNPTKNEANEYQNPTVLMVNNLPSEPIVTSKHLQTCRYFQNTEHELISAIQTELSRIPNSLWSTNDSPNGKWEVLPFLNQGSWVFEVCKKLPKTFDLLSKIPNLLDGCLFGNVMISKISPGTIIEPHCGPTNIRHRLQFAIQIPQQQSNGMFLRVVGPGTDSPSSSSSSSTTQYHHNLEWSHVGDYFVFDDSFVHSVSFPKPPEDDSIGNCDDSELNENQSSTTTDSSSSRIVLIIDLWHPDLTDAERILLQHLYPPFVSSSQLIS